ncbi:hypothetical protein SDJN03_17111, partial [Cucurbita argyrosperma subsp. sororia]
MKGVFVCRSIIVATTESHEEEGLHYHVGVLTEASRWTVVKFVRNAFKEWEGSSIDVKFHKEAWSTVVQYVLKEDRSPYVWGEFTEGDFMELVHCRSRHRKMKESVSERRIERLTEMHNVLELDEDSQFMGERFSSLPGIKEAHEDLQEKRIEYARL